MLKGYIVVNKTEVSYGIIYGDLQIIQNYFI